MTVRVVPVTPLPRPQASPSAAGSDHIAPTLRQQIINFVLLQAGWFAIVLGAAHGYAVWGTALALAIVVWHLATAARPMQELNLALAVMWVGIVFETVSLRFGYVRYEVGQWAAYLAPYWMIALWGLFAIALNVSMRWLKRRWLLAAALGAVAGPLSYVSGVKLGAAWFVQETPALVVLSIGWAIAMPVLMWLSDRFDGVALPDPGARRG